MTLSLYIRAALTPKTLLPILGSISAGVLLMTMQTTSAQAAGQYYNCANANGCKVVDNKYCTSSYTKTQSSSHLRHTGVAASQRYLESLIILMGFLKT